MKVADIFVRLGVRMSTREFAGADARLQGLARTAMYTGGAMSGLMSRFVGFTAIAGTLKGARDALDWDRQLTNLGIAADGALGSMDEFGQKATSVSNTVGISREEIVRGAHAFVAFTGDGKAAAESMETLGRVAKASNSNVEELAITAASLQQALGLKTSDFESAFSILIKAGKAGSVELRDMSHILSGILPLTSKFAGGGGLGGLADTSAAMQLVQRTYGGGADAARRTSTAIQGLVGGLTRNADKFLKKGVRIFDKDPKTGEQRYRNLKQIIDDIANSDLAKDRTLLTKAFGRKEGLYAYEQLVKNRDLWDEIADKARNANDVQKDFATVSESASGKVTLAWTRVSNFFKDQFSTVVVGKVDTLSMAGKDWDYFLSNLSIENVLGFWTDLFSNFSDDAIRFLTPLKEMLLEIFDPLTDAWNFVTGSAMDLAEKELERRARAESGGLDPGARSAVSAQAAELERMRTDPQYARTLAYPGQPPLARPTYAQPPLARPAYGQPALEGRAQSAGIVVNLSVDTNASPTSISRAIREELESWQRDAAAFLPAEAP